MPFWLRCGEFFLGGGAYVGLELLWRRRSHSSMFLAGGLCLVLIGWWSDCNQHRSLLLRILGGAGIITAVEFLTGIIVNRDYKVWDYRNQRGNLLGQVCPLFSLLWLPMAGAAMGLHNRLKK